MVKPGELSAQEQAEADARAARLARSRELELKAVGLMNQYGFFLPGPAKLFFRELADFLNWQKLKGVL